jgi:hypothetical protein
MKQIFSAFNQPTESSEKHETVSAPSPVCQTSNDYSIMQESTSLDAGNNNNLVYAGKKTNWTPVTESLSSA